MPGIALPLVGSLGAQFRSAPKPAAQATAEAGSTDARAAAQVPARTSPFRAVWSPLADEEPESEPQEESAPPASFAIPGYQAPAAQAAPRSPMETAVFEEQSRPAPEDPLNRPANRDERSARRTGRSAPASGPGGAAAKRANQEAPPRDLPASNARPAATATTTPVPAAPTLPPPAAAPLASPGIPLEQDSTAPPTPLPAREDSTAMPAGAEPPSGGGMLQAACVPVRRATPNAAPLDNNSAGPAPNEEPPAPAQPDPLQAGTAWMESGAAAKAPVAKPEARRAGEVKSSATASAGTAGRGARNAASPSEAAGVPEAEDSGTVRAARNQLAFTGRLAPLDAGLDTPSPGVAATAAQAPEPEIGASAAASGHAEPRPAADRATADSPGTVPAVDNSTAAPRAPSTSGTPASRATDPTVVDHPHGPAPAEANQAAATPASVNPSRPAQQLESSAAARDSGPARPAPAVEPAAPQKVAHDITLQLDSGSQRAAVRVVERGGELHVAVRTADADLAADLRQALPSLAAKLEQTGYRTETWHPGATAHRALETTAGNPGQNGNDQSGQGSFRERREGQPQPREAGQRTQTKKEGKDFAWFMSSLG